MFSPRTKRSVSVNWAAFRMWFPYSFPNTQTIFRVGKERLFLFKIYLKIQINARLLVERCNCCRSPLLVSFKIPDVHFSPFVLFIEMTSHSWAPQWYTSFNDPLKRHSRYTDFDAIAGQLNILLCPPDKIYAFLRPTKTYERLAQKTLGTKTILSRGVTGKTLLRNQ